MTPIRQVRRNVLRKREREFILEGEKWNAETFWIDEPCVHHSEPIRFSSLISEPVSQTRNPAVKKF